MQLKSGDEISELVTYLRKNGLKTDIKAREWLDKYIPNWREKHNTKITYEDIITDDSN